MKLVIADAHPGLKCAVAKVLGGTLQRCKVHFLRNALAHAGKGQRQMVRALINTAFAQESPEAAFLFRDRFTGTLGSKLRRMNEDLAHVHASVDQINARTKLMIQNNQLN